MKKKTNCGDCRYQMSGFDGGFFGSPFTCECHIFGETENRKSCKRFEKKITREYLFDKIYHLEKENEELELSIQLFEDDVKRLQEEKEQLRKELDFKEQEVRSLMRYRSI